ncbi:PPPDE putative peptidase domain-containing protein [Xylogone sp. PMI_703]|nr:PPPDE putative peptidase domain-containing protein [Xylogone sp. PMI_703]
MAPKKERKSGQHRSNHRSTLSLQKTKIVINVYDLLPPGKFASMLWTLGASLLHSGVVINDKEYAFGGHDRRGVTGVYWTKPKTEPPGGTYKCEILQGFTVAPQEEIDAIILEASEAFQGTAYNLLSKNCNHFSSYLCEKLTGRPGPSWLNRAASIGVALPCVVPKEWIAPPDFDTADGELLDDDDLDDTNERSRMLRDHDSRDRRLLDEPRASTAAEDAWDSEEERRQGGNGKGKAPMKDSSGRVMPASERAPVRNGR